MGIYIPSSAGLLEGFDRWSEGSSVDHMLHERSAWTSKDHPSRSNGRTMVEPYLSITSKDQVYPSRLSFDQNIFQMLSKSNRRMVDLVNLQTTKDIVYIQTQYRQSTDTSAPTPMIIAHLFCYLCVFLAFTRIIRFKLVSSHLFVPAYFCSNTIFFHELSSGHTKPKCQC
ncbi:hypothetical protein HanXRQr2_Chr11g0467921 [Helianthus annuus]|uniref:Uncharacterized protein n=1 Tax=Helianthus annuus TaxID=4232 RepID=A0A9K3HKL7_HELAN|nr:hypothetical protein HanXRQr2_Chr11g0467921 [Helianthus annuus]